MTRRRGPKTKLPAIPAKELQEALAREQRPYVRKRLIALRALMVGATRAEAALRANSNADTVDGWLRMARRSGWRALMRVLPGTKPRKVKDAAQVRAQIQTLLTGALDASERVRLLAVDQVLAGASITATARQMGNAPASVGRWLRIVRRVGVTSLLTKKRPRERRVEADAAALRALAAGTRNRRYAKALRAIAHLAEGETVWATAIKVDAAQQTIERRLEDFRKGGTQALMHSPYGHQRRLSPAQMAELAEVIRTKPGISARALIAAVKQRFGFEYTDGGLMRLVKEDMGFRHKGKQLIRN